MRISSIHNCKPFLFYGKRNISIKPSHDKENFTKNLQPDVFFIRMNTYKKDMDWANEMIELTYKTARMINNNENFDNILTTVEKGIQDINDPFNFFGYGVRRNFERRTFRLTKNGRGGEYFDKILNQIKNNFTPVPNNEYKDANTVKLAKSSTLNETIYIIQMTNNYDCKNLKLAKKEYNKLKKIKNPTIDDINKTCATIQWLITQGFCYEHGTDSIANTITKSIYTAYNVKVSRLKKNTSLDIEAFSSNLNDYIKNYPNYFEEKPKFNN